MVREKKISPDKITLIKKELGKLPAKDNSKSTRELILSLSTEISDAQKKGYSIEEVHKLLNDNGVMLKLSTLKSYLRTKSETKIIKPLQNVSNVISAKQDNTFVKADTPDDEL